ncbi:MAG TPA: hypothetical protein VK324_10945, partial [Tepidisphaeraceae bacterium]|nr:hypothetical protein [Tepidisphaeraceae bacterium]
MKFYRVRSRVPTIKPSLVIGPSLPATGSFLETHSDLVRSRRRVRELLADARIAHPFGEHAVQTIDVDPGV